MSQTSESYDALRARWDTLAADLLKCERLVDSSGLIPQRKESPFWRSFDAANAVFRKADVAQDSAMVSACYADLYRVESDAAALCKVTHKGKDEPLPLHDVEEATPGLKAAAATDKAATAAENAAADAARGGAGIWAVVPIGAKIAGGLVLGGWILSSVVKILRR